MNNIIEQIISLHEKELYSSVAKLCDFFVSSLNQKTEATLRLQVAYYYADSLYHLGEHQRSQYWFEHCLQLRKGISKSKNNKIQDKLNSTPRDVDIKYKLHLCYVALKKHNAALDILQQIISRQRNAKVNMAHANLLRDSGMERSAAFYYKAVLEENPWALDAAENLLRTGASGADISSLTLEVTTENNTLSLWLKAQAQHHSGDFRNAIKTYKSLDSSGAVRDNISLLLNLAYCYVYVCEEKKAIDVLKRLSKLESENRGLDLLATLLLTSDDPEDRDYLESLIPSQKDLSLFTPEQWVVMGSFMFTIKNYERALYFGHQSMFKKKTGYVEALFLKARAFFEMGKYQEVINHCTEAIEIDCYRLDIYKCLIGAYIKMNRLREAEVVALSACHKLHYSPQSLTLQAKVLFKGGTSNLKNIKKLLDKAITLDRESSTEAVIMLADVLENEQQYEQAKQMLLKQIENYPSSQLHQLLGECYINLQEDEEAFNQFNIALKLDPSNKKAIECLNLIGPLANPLTKRDSSYSWVGESSNETPNSNCRIDRQNEPEIWRMNRNSETPGFE